MPINTVGHSTCTCAHMHVHHNKSWPAGSTTKNPSIRMLMHPACQAPHARPGHTPALTRSAQPLAHHTCRSPCRRMQRMCSAGGREPDSGSYVGDIWGGSSTSHACATCIRQVCGRPGTGRPLTGATPVWEVHRVSAGRVPLNMGMAEVTWISTFFRRSAERGEL